MSPDTRPRIAVVCSRPDDREKLPRELFKHCQVHLFESAEGVMEALRLGQHYSGLFFDTGNFLQAIGCVAGDQRPQGLERAERPCDPEASGIWREMHLHEARREMDRRACGGSGNPAFHPDKP